MTSSPYSFDVNSENFTQIVLQGSEECLVLVDFWADWCAPCKMLMPVLSKLAEEMNGQFILAKVNSDQQQALAQEYGVKSLPTVKLFKQGVVVDEFTGAQSENLIRQMLDQHIIRASDHMLTQAMQLKAKGDIDDTLTLLRQANKEDPGRKKVVTALAAILADKEEISEAESLLNSLAASDRGEPEVAALLAKLEFARHSEDQTDIDDLQKKINQDENNLDARFKLATQAIHREDYQTGLDQLLEIMKRNRDFQDDIGRKTMLKVFDMLGDNPVTANYRRKMFNLLY